MAFSTRILKNITKSSEVLNEGLLLETRGEDTAHSGFANEHFTHQHLTDYVRHISRGDDHDSAIQKIQKAKYSPAKIKPDHPINRAVAAIGHEEVGKIHDDSRDTAVSIVKHLKENYSLGVTGSHHVGKVGTAGAEEVRKLTGKPSNADVVVQTVNPKKKKGFALAHLEHLGASLKYSKGAGGDIKIHSPSISHMADIIDDHHEQMHGSRFGIQENLKKEVSKGIAAQREIVKKHASILAKHFKSKEFTQNKDKKHLKKYLGKVGKAEDYSKGILNPAGVSYIRNHPKLRPIYDQMAAENLKMKQKIAQHIHNGVKAVLNNQDQSAKTKNIKESLVRSIGNIQKPGESDSLPTFLVSTERGKATQIYDVHSHFQRHFDENGLDQNSYSKGSSSMKIGPANLTIDARPATTGNPLNNPANVTVSASSLKKGSGSKKLKEEVTKAALAAQIFESRMSKEEKRAAAAERIQSAATAAMRNRQIQKARATAEAESKSADYARQSKAANIAAGAIRKQTAEPETQTYWRDESGMIRGVGGARFAAAMAKNINLSDRSPDLFESQEVSEEAPANAMGTAGISGLDTAVNVGIAGRDMLLAPGPLRRPPPKMFGGKRVFTVPSSDYYKATLGKKKGQHWRSMVNGPLGEEIRQYALDNKDAPIIVEDETTGAMMYLRYGKR